MSRRRTSKKQSGSQSQILLVSILIIIAVVIGGYFLYQNLQPAPVPVPTDTADESEKQVGDASRQNPTVPPGTIAAPVQIGSGGTTKTDWYELYFTNPIYPNNPKNHQGGPDVPLAKLMDTATKTLDVADYDFDLESVTQAMVRAKGRGVVVRMVTDSDTINNVKNKEVQAAFAKLKEAKIPFIGDERGPIMHNKFTVVDNKVISTGSMNYTDGDAYHLNNNLIIINNSQLAQNYTAEFEKMFVKKQFGPNKDKGVPNPVLTISGVKVENYFSAEDGVAQHIIDTIKANAKQSIYFMAFSFTHDGIAQAMEEKAKAGVKLGGVFETTGSDTAFSEYGKLKKAGYEVYTDGNPWVMHHKVIIIDEQIVIFGSFNFSSNADKANDENLLIVYDAVMAKAFKAEYDRVLTLAKNPPVKKGAK